MRYIVRWLQNLIIRTDRRLFQQIDSDNAWRMRGSSASADSPGKCFQKYFALPQKAHFCQVAPRVMQKSHKKQLNSSDRFSTNAS